MTSVAIEHSLAYADGRNRVPNMRGLTNVPEAERGGKLLWQREAERNPDDVCVWGGRSCVPRPYGSLFSEELDGIGEPSLVLPDPPEDKGVSCRHGATNRPLDVRE